MTSCLGLCRLFCVFALVLLFSPPCTRALQLRMGGAGSGVDVGSLKVRVTDENDRPIGVRAHVQLMMAGGASTTGDAYCDEDGIVNFNGVPVGTYDLVVSGEGLERTDSGPFEVDNRKTTQAMYIQVKRTADVQAEEASNGGGIVSVRDLNVPKAAGKEFDHATRDMGNQDWKRAAVHLKKAIAVYPKFVDAYNNLGAAYRRLGDVLQARQAWQKAIELDQKFAPALLNLGRLAIGERKYTDAEGLLSRASAADGGNPQILMLLGQSQLLAGHFDQAIASEDKVHALPHHEKYALSYCIAARAFEHENRGPEAVAQLQAFLQEQPKGLLADAVRKELTRLDAVMANSIRR